MFKPLGSSSYRPLGSKGPAENEAAERIESLPGSVFFAAWESGADRTRAPGVYYKDRHDILRRLVARAPGGFRYLPAIELEAFAELGTIIFIPELDPRAWAANPEQVGKEIPEIDALPADCFFSALQVGESKDSNRLGVYHLGADGRIRRLLRNFHGGIELSEPVPRDRFEAFGEVVSLQEK